MIYFCIPEPPVDFLLTESPGKPYDLRQWSPTFPAPRRQFFHRPGGREMASGWLKCITFIVTLFLLFLHHQFHLKSPGIRTQRVETPVLRYISKFIFLVYEHPIISALFVEKLTTLTDLPLHFCINKKSLLIYIRV